MHVRVDQRPVESAEPLLQRRPHFVEDFFSGALFRRLTDGRDADAIPIGNVDGDDVRNVAAAEFPCDVTLPELRLRHGTECPRMIDDSENTARHLHRRAQVDHQPVHPVDV